jgi:MYXO-CTERM domain-containing protein
MRITFWLPLWAGLLAPIVQAGTVQFEVSNLGSGSYQYTYLLSGFTFQANEDLDVQFDPGIYAALSNPTAGDPTQFTAMAFQPDPASGDYIALALVNSPSLAGPFEVDFTLVGGGQPGPQPYSLNQFDPNGFLLGTVATGETSLASTTAPEPGGVMLGGVGLLLLAGAAFARRRTSSTA